MATQQKLKAMREQKARKSAFYKQKREANPASKDYVKPDKSSTDKPKPKPKPKSKTTDKPKTKTKTTAKTTPKPTGTPAVKPGIIARGAGILSRGVSAASKGFRGGPAMAIGALGAWAVSEALKFDPKVAREQLGGGSPKGKLSKRQRIVAEMQGKTPPVSEDKVTPPRAGSPGKTRGVTKPKPTTSRPERVDDYNYPPRKKSTTPLSTLGRQKSSAPILKVSSPKLSEPGASTLRANQANYTKTPTNIKDKFDKDKFDKFRQDSSKGDRHLGAPKKKPLGMEDAFWDGSSWVR